MSDQSIVDRLAAHRLLSAVPRAELEWLASRGNLQRLAVGDLVASKARPVESLYVILSGEVAISVDRGSGPHKVMEFHAGDITGALPYSRMRTAPGDSVAVEPTEAFTLHQDFFPELIRDCYHVTATCVHVMIDRAKTFNTADFHHEKMQSLGRLAAGLAHELNNPASAIARSSAALSGYILDAERAARAVGAAQLEEKQLATIDGFRTAMKDEHAPAGPALEQADREEAVGDWLAARHLGSEAADALSHLSRPVAWLDKLEASIDRRALEVAVRHIAAGHEAQEVAGEIGRASARISELVASVKGFTHRDQESVLQPLDIGAGLRDTLTMLTAKARNKTVSVKLDVEPALPMVQGYGGELNQVWMNLIENAIDAAPANGHVTVIAALERGCVGVRILDDGPGIPPEPRKRVFEPFFTTKAPGEGTGLGLDIARRIVDHHEGDIEFDSSPAGTEFHVTVPIDLQKRQEKRQGERAS